VQKPIPFNKHFKEQLFLTVGEKFALVLKTLITKKQNFLQQKKTLSKFLLWHRGNGSNGWKCRRS
jgi:hypothetical protein